MQKLVETTRELVTETPIIGNTHEMRVFLIQQMIGVAKGEIEPQQVTAVARMAQQVYNFAKFEVTAARMRAQSKSEEVKPLEL